jgi:VIT1/CCC1 family predicted Fe2+/Mn2+ transporter
MDAAMVSALAALIGAPVAGAAAVYGSRAAGRAQREGGIIGGYNSLTDQLQEERKELRAELSTLRTDLAVERAESARLRLLVTQLGGQP